MNQARIVHGEILAKKEKEEEDQKTQAYKEFLENDKDVASLRTAIEDLSAVYDNLDNKVKVTVNVPITFTATYSSNDNTLSIVEDVYGHGDVDLSELFDMDNFEITIGRGDLTAAQKKVIQEMVDDNIGDVCMNGLILFPEKYNEAKEIVKAANKARKLAQTITDKDQSGEFSVHDLFPDED
jgi:hypothetical protein